jgi:hypothetical protein
MPNLGKRTWCVELRFMSFPYAQGVAVPDEDNIDVVYDLSSSNYLSPQTLNVPEAGSRLSTLPSPGMRDRTPSNYFNYSSPQVGL